MSSTDFSSLKLKPELLANLKTLGYHEMTAIQAKSLPGIVAGKDVVGQGKTGSGKTAAFGLGVLQALAVKRFRVQSLVLCPTRELADQVAKEMRKLGRGIHNIKILTLCGGMPFGPQVGSLEHGAHIIVGTPGRVEEHVRKGTLSLEHVQTFVLDEADRMLDMGFQESLDNIIEATPANRQTLLFSATFPDEIEAISRRITQAPLHVKVESTHDDSSITQVFYELAEQSRLDVLRLLLMHYQPESAVVFCNTKLETQELADELRAYDFSALALHGDLEQRERDQTLVRFANKSISILVATDVAARGLDIETLDLVVNFQMPRDLDVYVHRIGRTGRAGSSGCACTIFSGKERFKLEKLSEKLGQTVEASPVPPMRLLDQPTFQPSMVTLQIDGGKKQKVRPGDILGALTGEQGIEGKQVGKIQIFDNKAYVAVAQDAAQKAFKKLAGGKLKGRNFKVRRFDA